MKKLVISLLALLLVGCSAPSTTVPETTITPSASPTAKISVLAPKGATAIAVLALLDDEAYEVTLVDGTDIIQAALVEANGKYDLIIAPSNLGAKLANAGKTNYRMSAVLTWGNLYLVGKDEAKLTDPNATIALFGDQAVPGIVYEMTKGDRVLSETYYGAVNEAQAQLLANKVDLALLAEPAASATISKDPSLKIVADLQEDYREKTNLEGYPQASLFVEQSKYEADKVGMDAAIEKIKTSLSTYETDQTSLQNLIEKATPELLGVPSAALIVKTYGRLNLKFVYAKDAVNELDAFLKELGINEPSTYIIN